MTVQDSNVIDIVAHDPKTGTVILSMVEVREWGTSGELLFDLQAKINTYLAYAIEGQLLADYPALKGKPVTIRLHHQHELGPLELEFIEMVRRNVLEPAGIGWIASSLNA